jgi:hypothetical protein
MGGWGGTTDLTRIRGRCAVGWLLFEPDGRKQNRVYAFQLAVAPCCILTAQCKIVVTLHPNFSKCFLEQLHTQLW